MKRFRRLGYEHVAINGQKGYHGVAVASRVPFESVTIDNYCGKSDCRHIAVTLGEKAGYRDPVTVHNFYVPAGGDEPDPAINEKFAHKLAFLDELHGMEKLRPASGERAILVGDLNVAPLEHDVWSHKQMLKVVSHTPVETEKLTAFQKAGSWVDSMRRAHARAREALYVVELSRDGQLEDRRPRPPPRPHLGVAAAWRSRVARRHRQERARLGAPVGPRAGDRDRRGVIALAYPSPEGGGWRASARRVGFLFGTTPPPRYARTLPLRREG